MKESLLSTVEQLGKDLPEEKLGTYVFEIIKQAASEGNIKARLYLAVSHLVGTDYIKQDREKGVLLLETLAEQGDTQLKYELGRCYYYGKVLEQNKAKAMYWYKKAAAEGHTLALEALE